MHLIIDHKHFQIFGLLMYIMEHIKIQLQYSIVSCASLIRWQPLLHRKVMQSLLRL